MCKSQSDYMNMAISIAQNCLNDSRRYPFGAIIVKDDKIVGVGKEATCVNNDPTAHSEIEAIRSACQNLKTNNLSNCILYTSSEPCSMCLSALFWAQIDTVYYACSREDVFKFGFSDRFELVEKRESMGNAFLKKIRLHQMNNKKAIQVFNNWAVREEDIKIT